MSAPVIASPDPENPVYSVNHPMTVTLNPVYRYICFASLLALLLLCVLWELVLDPLVPGGSIYVLKALPLIFPLYGVYKGNLYTMQWSSMLVLLYMMEGTVRWYSDLSATSMYLAMAETLLSLVIFVSAILYVRPAKKVARATKKQGK